MNLRSIGVLLVGVLLIAGAWRTGGWSGVLLVAGAIVMYLLLYFNRMMHVLRKAADRPKGYVGSAVMLNAKLKPGVNLLHVMAMTQSIGEPLTPVGEDPEIFRWTDGTQSSVTCEFVAGRLAKWSLHRPAEGEGAGNSGGNPAGDSPAP